MQSAPAQHAPLVEHVTRRASLRGGGAELTETGSKMMSKLPHSWSWLSANTAHRALLIAARLASSSPFSVSQPGRGLSTEQGQHQYHHQQAAFRFGLEPSTRNEKGRKELKATVRGAHKLHSGIGHRSRHCKPVGTKIIRNASGFNVSPFFLPFLERPALKPPSPPLRENGKKSVENGPTKICWRGCCRTRPCPARGRRPRRCGPPQSPRPRRC